MNQLISDEDYANYCRLVDELNQLHANNFTQSELSKHFGVSVRKISDFQNKKLIDFWLLTQYAAIIGKQIEFDFSY